MDNDRQAIPALTPERLEALAGAIQYLDSIEEYGHADAIRMIMPLEGFDHALPTTIR